MTTDQTENITPEWTEAEVADDLRSAVRGFLARAEDSESGADTYDESARRERRLAAEYRAKADLLGTYLDRLDIAPDATVDATVDS